MPRVVLPSPKCIVTNGRHDWSNCHAASAAPFDRSHFLPRSQTDEGAPMRKMCPIVTVRHGRNGINLPRKIDGWLGLETLSMCPTLTLVDVIITTDHRIVGMKQISLVKVFLPPFIAWFRLAAARRRPRSIGPSALSAVHGTAACLSFQNEQRRRAIYKGHPQNFHDLSAIRTDLSYNVHSAHPPSHTVRTSLKDGPH